MKSAKGRLLVLALTLPFMLCRSGPAHAQAPGSQVQTFTTSVQSLITFLQQTAGNDPNQQALANDLQVQFSSLTSTQLAQLASAYDITAFSNAVTNVVGAQPSNRVQPPTDPPANLFAPNFSICSLLEGQSVGPIQVPSDPAIIKPIDTAIQVAQIAKDIADRLCDSIVVALGGTNLPGCIIAQVADLILDGLVKTREVLTFCDAPVRTAEVEATWRNTIQVDTDLSNHDTNVNNHLNQIDSHLTLIDSELSTQNNSIDTNVNANIAAVGLNLANSITNTDADLNNHITATDTDLNTHLTGVDTDVLNRATQIDTEISTLQGLSLRIFIERSLAAGLVIGLFEVPTAQGGYLDLVRSIVVDTINKILASGGTVGTASKSLTTGDAAKAAGQFKSAYSSYASAYQAAVH